MTRARFHAAGWGGGDLSIGAYIDLRDRDADAPLQTGVVAEGQVLASVVAHWMDGVNGRPGRFVVGPVTPLTETPAWQVEFVPGEGWSVVKGGRR